MSTQNKSFDIEERFLLTIFIEKNPYLKLKFKVVHCLCAIQFHYPLSGTKTCDFVS